MCLYKKGGGSIWVLFSHLPTPQRPLRKTPQYLRTMTYSRTINEFKTHLENLYTNVDTIANDLSKLMTFVEERLPEYYPQPNVISVIHEFSQPIITSSIAARIHANTTRQINVQYVADTAKLFVEELGDFAQLLKDDDVEWAFRISSGEQYPDTVVKAVEELLDVVRHNIDVLSEEIGKMSVSCGPTPTQAGTRPGVTGKLRSSLDKLRLRHRWNRLKQAMSLRRIIGRRKGTQ